LIDELNKSNKHFTNRVIIKEDEKLKSEKFQEDTKESEDQNVKVEIDQYESCKDLGVADYIDDSNNNNFNINKPSIKSNLNNLSSKPM